MILSLTVWQPRPGRTEDLIGSLIVARRIHERLGARVVIWRAEAGGAPPDGLTYTLEFDDLASYGAFAERLAHDEAWLRHTAIRDQADAGRLVSTALVSEVDRG